MNRQYIAWFNNAETGPMSLDDLRSFISDANLSPLTPVRACDEINWSPWKNICSRPEAAPRSAQHGYIIRINGEERGPVTFSDLEMYERVGEIDGRTQVRKSNAGHWRDWATEREMRQAERMQPQLSSALIAPAARSDKSRGIYIILALLFGLYGFHDFYAGRILAGFALLITSCLFSGIGLAVALSGNGVGILLMLIFPIIWGLTEAFIVTKDGEGREMC